MEAYHSSYPTTLAPLKKEEVVSITSSTTQEDNIRCSSGPRSGCFRLLLCFYSEAISIIPHPIFSSFLFHPYIARFFLLNNATSPSNILGYFFIYIFHFWGFSLRAFFFHSFEDAFHSIFNPFFNLQRSRPLKGMAERPPRRRGSSFFDSAKYACVIFRGFL